MMVVMVVMVMMHFGQGELARMMMVVPEENMVVVAFGSGNGALTCIVGLGLIRTPPAPPRACADVMCRHTHVSARRAIFSPFLFPHPHCLPPRFLFPLGAHVPCVLHAAWCLQSEGC